MGALMRMSARIASKASTKVPLKADEAGLHKVILRSTVRGAHSIFAVCKARGRLPRDSARRFRHAHQGPGLQVLKDCDEAIVLLLNERVCILCMRKSDEYRALEH
jgi:hypothetical protein